MAARIIAEKAILKAELNNGTSTTGAVRVIQQKLADIDEHADLTDSTVLDAILSISSTAANVLLKSIYQTTITQIGQLTR